MSVTSPAPVASKRLLWVDTLRGIAICLVVFHHSFIVVPRFSEFLNSVDEAVITLRMPLLFFVSGCMVPGSMRRGMKHYLDSRVRHVIWPYLGWQAQYIVMVGSVMGLFNLVYWGPMSTLWFLFFLIVYYLIAPLSRYVTWFGLSAAGLVLWLLIPYKTLPDLLGAYTLTPREMAFYAFFFYLGAATFGWIRAFRATRAQVLGAGLVLAVCLAIAAQGVVKFTWEFLLLGVAGGAAMLVLFTAMPDNPAMRAEATYFFKPRAGRDTEEFYADSRYGELWVGRRPTLDEVETRIGIPCAHIDTLRDRLAKDVGPELNLLVVRDVDPGIEAMVDEVRGQNSLSTGEQAVAEHDRLAEFASEQRLVKDEFEIGEMRKAVAATIAGFEDVVRHLPRAVAHERGERVIEGVFEMTARAEGNGVGYDTIAAAGPHACTLHWIRNDGKVREGEMVLIDAGVEVDSLYTADITRSIPINGKFSPVQRKIYEAVLEAADAVFAVAKPGMKFRELHQTAMQVIVRKLDEWDLLPCSQEESLSPDGQFHRRYMVHGTSHHLGMDVHDCAQARREMYLDAELEPGMVFTIEPGLYFMENDLTVPEEMRGIGVRIEDDVLVTEDGVENLSAAIPRTPDEIERWMAGLRG
ncbi:M24 family metallopeptidase [Dermabacteraceae bacterium P13101]